MEQWGATWAQNFNSMEINHLLSKMRVEKMHPDWKSWKIMRQVTKTEFHYRKICYLMHSY